MQSTDSPGGILWSPDSTERADTTLTRFAEYVNDVRGIEVDDYEDLWQWSVTDLESFWSSVWDFFGLDSESSYDAVLLDDQMPGARWFPGARINFARALLDRGDPDSAAVVAADESGVVRTLTRSELREQVLVLAAELEARAVGRNDVVVGYLPNIAETVIAFLATATLGATWASVGQDYAPDAVIDRFSQLAPKVLIAADGYTYAGRQHSRIEAVTQIAAGLQSLTDVVVVQHISPDNTLAGTRSDGSSPAWHDWAAAISGRVARSSFTEVDFDHPLWVLFSSGTTGRPKGLVHGHGGILVETVKQMGLHWDIGSGDRVLWYTSPSWMMWNMQVTVLLSGASIVCYDGSPTYPHTDSLWKLAADTGATFVGTSPGYLQACADAGAHPKVDHPLSKLRAVGSTGAPLSEHLYRWAYDAVGDVPLWSMSGGTDVAGALAGAVPTRPVRIGRISGRCLGVALETWDMNGNPVRGAVGDLVVTRPLPNMPIALWNDPDGTKYHDAYFDTYPGVWRQGDWATIYDDGTVAVHGRSDSTLNRNGVRMGSSDIYSAVEALPEIAEALVLGIEQADGSYWMPLFVVLHDNHVLDAGLTSKISSAIRDQVSPRHVPDDVLEVVGIPHTRTGKKIEVPLKRVLQGGRVEDVVNLDGIDDPSLLGFFERLAEQRQANASTKS
ncbi:acetoacetate--CoA ligase [Rhodococcus tukisamuensis]|uniref:Acetyl-CoA synthetase/acetoacetyl-CoA synthetase n=1 Tax=Rhodococcus tukisamuensis TaxID=168276 RepID=A0A1G6T414_9NOCA|nr:acetoacetate--CoA ligase [Rhodococcus tukisamuensis]SDD23900.1 acetyl-CoA synthetase/acetoacetyl-CoA synthetase [Rhodococcus tukisamuensis]